MNEATMTESATANPASAGESAAPSDLYAVKMTAEEMDAQRKLWVEYVHAITRDEKRADELQRKIIFRPSS